MGRFLQLTLLSLLFLTAGAVAAPSWDAFHKALDLYEYEKARELAKAFPTGGPRELALAEVEVQSTWRAERTFAYTDAISLDKLAPELRAKYYYVRAHQEYHTARGSAVEKQKAVKRMLDEGLGQKESNSHDISQLLLYQIPSSTYLGVEPEPLLKRLANLPGIDPAIVLRGQAFLASSQKQPEQAASLWTMLARDARRTGHLRAARFSEIRAISARRVPSLANLITARRMLKEAVAAGDAYSVGRLWGMRDDIPAANFEAWHQEIARACSTLPLSRAKIEVMFELTSHGRAPEPARTQIEREGVKLARQIGDNCLEFKFLSNQMNSKDPAVARQATERREALMANMDLRGQELYVKNPVAGGKSQTPADKSEYTLEDVEADLAALDPELGPKERIFVYDRFLSRGYGTGNYALAETCFFRGLEESLRLEGVDQHNGLNFLIPCGATHDPEPC